MPQMQNIGKQIFAARSKERRRLEENRLRQENHDLRILHVCALFDLYCEDNKMSIYRKAWSEKKLELLMRKFPMRKAASQHQQPSSE